MKNNHSYIQRMAAWAMALPACVALVLTGCTNEQITDAVEAPQTRTVTFTAVAPEGAGSRALWESEPASSGKLGFAWEPETDNMIDLFWVGANSLPTNATLSDHSGALVTVTGEAPNSFTQVIALFPAGSIEYSYVDLYRTLPTPLTQKGNTTDHLRDYMYMNGVIDASEVTDGTGVMQLTHGCAVLRFNVKNGGTSNVRVTKVEMLAASENMGVKTRAAITSGALIYSHPKNIAVNVQDATDATKGHLLAAKSGETIESLSVYAHCFPTNISDGQFLFLVTVTDADGENEKTYITKEAFSVSGITTTDDTDNTQKMFKAGYYYTFNLDIANTTRFGELPDYTTQTDGEGNVGYIVNTYAGLWAWLIASRDSGVEIDLTLNADIDLTNADLDGDPNNLSNWPSDLVLNNMTIDGGGHTLTGLKMDVSGDGENASMFRIVNETSVVKNLHLQNVQLSSSQYNAAGVVADNYGTVSGCSVSGTIESTADSYNAAGVVAHNSGTVTACYNTGNASATGTGASAGGVVGYNSGTVTACYNTGNASATGTGAFAGGVIGSNSNTATVSACYWSGQDVTNGIGVGAANNDNATKVDGATVTWNSTVMSAMNNALPAGFGWQYVENTVNATKEKEPLKLQKVTP